jgi:predicted acylesterase/phospholipase RssA
MTNATHNVPAAPALACDLILKGGVTSGVVYPPAVLTLSETFHFRSIGGASAGAIAAALTAAAEYGRQRALRDHRYASPRSGFEGLRQLDAAVSTPGFMERLFVARGPHRTVLAAVFKFTAVSQSLHRRAEQRNALTRALLRIVLLAGVLLGCFPFASTAGAIVAAGLVAWVSAESLGAMAASRWLALSIALVLGALAGSLSSLGWRVRDLRSNGFGLCSGSAGQDTDASDPTRLELTDWLHHWINALAGRGPADPPLTIRELKEGHGIVLKLMSANLNLSQAFVLPLERGSRSFFFRADELRPLFPPPVLDYLREWGEKNPPTRLKLAAESDYLRLPMGDDLPVIVATRLSLSFPLLLSAVRIYSFKDEAYARSKSGSVAAADYVEEHWMSDGGITSNFPVHLFDTWIPERPTFGITLYDSPVPGTFSQREQTNGAVLLPRPEHFHHARPPRFAIGGTFDFLRAVFQTAQSHRDVALTGLPSYRERVVQIFLEPHEGGLNLSMSAETIDGIKAKGKRAAEELLERYVAGDHLSAGFQEHLWVRMLVLLSQLEKQFALVRNGGAAGSKDALEQQYRGLLQAQLAASPPWYRSQNEEWTKRAETRVRALIALIDAWDQDHGPLFSVNPPRPEGRLRVTSET